MNANGTKNETTLGVPYETALDVGARLRAAREQDGRSPSAVAAKIKLREHYITAIEQGQWNELPPGLNGRGLVRIYAREMGIEVKELEPRSAVTATHPQYEPVSQVSVISRQALMERELTRASQQIARSVPRSGGGSLHGTRPVTRAAELRPAPLSMPSGNGGRLDRSAQEIIQRNTHATVGRLSSNEDEAPLDVVTPDVASILGLTEQDLSGARNDTKPVVPPALPRGDSIPEVSAEMMAAEMFGGADTRSNFGDAPETAPLSRIFHDAPAGIHGASLTDRKDARAFEDDTCANEGPLPLDENAPSSMPLSAIGIGAAGTAGESMGSGANAHPEANTTTTFSTSNSAQAAGRKESRKDRTRREAEELAQRRAADERAAADRAVAARAEAERMVAERAAAERASKDRESEERAALERAASERAAQYTASIPATQTATQPATQSAAPATQPAAPASEEQARWQRNTALTVPVGFESADGASPTQATSAAASAEANAEATSALAAMAATLHDRGTPAAGATPSEWPHSGVTSETVKPVSVPGRTTARGLSPKALVGYTAAALLLVGVGAVFYARSRVEQSSENGALVGKTAAGDEVQTGAVDGNSGADTNAGAPPDSSASVSSTADTNSASAKANIPDPAAPASGAAPALPVAAADTAATGASTNAAPTEAVPAAVSAEAVPAAPAAAPAVAAAAATAAPVEPAAVATAAASAQNTETSIMGTGQAKQAKLTLLESVDVQVTVDGKRLYSGVRPPGVLTIDFGKSVEIFVGDGSKAKLSYGTWDHGLLGHEGRKRRIFLNADSFAPPSAP